MGYDIRGVDLVVIVLACLASQINAWSAAVQDVECGCHEVDITVRLLDGETRSCAVTSAQVLEHGQPFYGLDELRSHQSTICSSQSQVGRIVLIRLRGAQQIPQRRDDVSVRGHYRGTGSSAGKLS